MTHSAQVVLAVRVKLLNASRNHACRNSVVADAYVADVAPDYEAVRVHELNCQADVHICTSKVCGYGGWSKKK